jgi:hypothetical protein
MKRRLILCLLLLAPGLYAQSLPDDFKLNYDRIRDTTTITRKESFIRASKDSKAKGVVVVGFTATIFQAGNAEPRYILDFASYSCRVFCFSSVREVALLADDKRLRLAASWSRTSQGEQIRAYVSREVLEQLAAARKVEFAVGPFAAEFAKNDRQTLKDILEIGGPWHKK